MADITYIHTQRDGWCYLASVLDCHTKKIVGYKFGRKMTVVIILEALDHAVAAQNPAPGLILYTDLGSQYTSEVFGERLKKYEIIPSFSWKG
ncbi:transposase InsO family protein [Lysinibacillus sp. TE18511]